MDDDGSWFGVVDPGFSVVPEGWESVIEPLVTKQLRVREGARRRGRAASRPPAARGGAWRFTHARVLDVEGGRWLADQTVLVMGDTIAAVGPAKTTKIPGGAETLDVAGKALLPGLWDMHAHLSQPDGALNIASGVTTVRDVGNDPDRLDDFKKRFDDGTAVGPHVLRAGFIEGRERERRLVQGHGGDARPRRRPAVELFAKRGYEMMKIYNSSGPSSSRSSRRRRTRAGCR